MLFSCRRITLMLLVINTSSSFPVKNKRRRFPATSVNNLLQSVATKCIALGSRTVHSMRWSQISTTTTRLLGIWQPMAENRLSHLHSKLPLGGPRTDIAMTYGMEKLRRCSIGWKKLKISLFVSTECTNVTDKRKDRQTDKHGHRMTACHACIASRCKN